MAPKIQELGERQHVDMRTGVNGFPGWRGVSRTGRPGTIADDQVWTGQNVRNSGGIFVTRGGQAKVNSTNIPEIQGFYDATDIGAATTGGEASRTLTGFIVPSPWWVDEEQLLSVDSAQTPEVTHYAVSTDRVANTLFNSSRLYYTGTSVDTGTSCLLQFTGFGTNTTIWDPTTDSGFTDTHTLLGLCVNGATMFIGSDVIPGVGSRNTSIYTWTGSGTPTLDNSFAVTTNNQDRFFAFVFGTETVFAFKTGATSQFWTRSAGGVWTQLTLPVGWANFKAIGGAEFGGKFYWSGVDSVAGQGGLLSYDGLSTTLAVEHSSSGSYGAAFSFNSTLLYYFHDTAPWIGRFDGATWTDQLFDLNAGGFAINNPDGIASFWVQDSNAWCFVVSPFEDAKMHRLAIHSNGTDTATWLLGTNETSTATYGSVGSRAQLYATQIDGINLG